jgi:hypothetical protein
LQTANQDGWIALLFTHICKL